MSLSPTFAAGLDIGGTTIKAMLVDSDGAPVGELAEVRSHVDQGFRKTFKQLKTAVDEPPPTRGRPGAVDCSDGMG